MSWNAGLAHSNAKKTWLYSTEPFIYMPKASFTWVSGSINPCKGAIFPCMECTCVPWRLVQAACLNQWQAASCMDLHKSPCTSWSVHLCGSNAHIRIALRSMHLDLHTLGFACKSVQVLAASCLSLICLQDGPLQVYRSVCLGEWEHNHFICFFFKSQCEDKVVIQR